MPSRVIRDGLLDSQRYWNATVEARQLFIHLMLLADDFGLVSLAPVFIRRRCFDDAPTPAKIDKLLEQLVDADLIRIYTVGNTQNPARYAFIPKFGQRLRQMRARYPKPPAELYADDLGARNLFSTHAHLFEKLSPTWHRIVSSPRTEVESKGIEKETKGETKATVPHIHATSKSVIDWATELGLRREPGEHEGAFQARVAFAVQERKRTSA